jgi:hypothetical protein
MIGLPKTPMNYMLPPKILEHFYESSLSIEEDPFCECVLALGGAALGWLLP